jgi:hypothetical protein
MAEKQILEELERLTKIYYERKKEFAKAGRIRWLISFIGFALVFCFILIQGNLKFLFTAGIKNILIILLVGTVMTGFYFFVNVSVFGWLFQKDIAEGRRLVDIENEIIELEKTLRQRR